MASKKPKAVIVATGIFFPVIAALLADAIGAISIGNIVNSAASVVRCVMLTEIPLWSILLTASLLFAAVFAYLSLVIYRRPGWLDFTKMMREGRLFKWSYDEDAEPADIVELCPECEYELDGSNCPMCGWMHWDISKTHALRVFSLQFRMELKKMIKWHIEKGTYKDLMAQKQG